MLNQVRLSGLEPETYGLKVRPDHHRPFTMLLKRSNLAYGRHPKLFKWFNLTWLMLCFPSFVGRIVGR
jgi:hypothetical protein